MNYSPNNRPFTQDDVINDDFIEYEFTKCTVKELTEDSEGNIISTREVNKNIKSVRVYDPNPCLTASMYSVTNMQRAGIPLDNFKGTYLEKDIASINNALARVNSYLDSNPDVINNQSKTE